MKTGYQGAHVVDSTWVPSAPQPGRTVLAADAGRLYARLGMLNSGKLGHFSRELSVSRPYRHDPRKAGDFMRRLLEWLGGSLDCAVISVTEPHAEMPRDMPAMDIGKIRQHVAKSKPSSVAVLALDSAVCAAAGVVALPSKRLVQFSGPPAMLGEAKGAIVISLGVGLGIARLTRASDGWMVTPTGLERLAPGKCGEEGADLVKEWMGNQFSDVRVEHYVSGQGIANIARALAGSQNPGGAMLLKDMDNPRQPAVDGARWVAGIARDRPRGEGAYGYSGQRYRLCVQAMDLFCEQLGYLVAFLVIEYGLPIVLAGPPVASNRELLLNKHWGLAARAGWSELVERVPIYLATQVGGPKQDEVTLLGAGLIGTATQPA